jgi:hypothetical protein
VERPEGEHLCGPFVEDGVTGEECHQLVQQCRAIDRRGPGFGVRELDTPCGLLRVGAALFYFGVEGQRPNAKGFCRRGATAVVVNRREIG